MRRVSLATGISVRDLEFKFVEPPQQIPIPRLFQSVYCEDLFAECSGCQCDLLTDHVPYAVAKHIVVAEPVFEMALCLTCVAAMQSLETRERISEFVRNLQLQKPPIETTNFTWEDGLRACLLCDKPREKCRRYQILGVCIQRELIVVPPPTPSPYLMCEDCNEQLTALLSQETKDNWDRFMEQQHDDPPGIRVDGPRLDPVFV